MKSDCLAIRAIEDPVVVELANTLGTTPATVVLSWVVQRGIVVLTKSVTPSRIKSNLKGNSDQISIWMKNIIDFDAVFELPTDAFDKVASLDRNHRYNLPARRK